MADRKVIAGRATPVSISGDEAGYLQEIIDQLVLVVAGAIPASAADRILENQAMLNAELTLQETGGTLTASGAEQTLYINNQPMGSFVPRVLYVDLNNMAGGDTTVFRVYYRLASGGALLQQDYQSYTGADGGLSDSNVLIAIDLGPTRFGVRVTLDQTGGVNRDYAWSVFEENVA